MSAPGINFQGIILIDIAGLGLIILILHLIRSNRLFVGYGVIWLISSAAIMITVSIPPLLDFVTRAVGAVLSASALSLLAFIFIFLVLIFFSVKLSNISARQIEIAQYLALKEVKSREECAWKPSSDKDFKSE